MFPVRPNQGRSVSQTSHTGKLNTGNTGDTGNTDERYKAETTSTIKTMWNKKQTEN